ncbi:MAG: flippase-like domain-containing protein [SAR324 cluster bacterium]|nr:flippase-like domain-containing protein [SAR324 cluster bacterium]
MKKIIINLLKLALVGGILYYLISDDRIDFKLLLLYWKHPSTLVTLVAIMSLWIVSLAALRWWLLLKAIGLEVPLKRAVLLCWIGNFFNMALPGAVSGDFVKGYYIIRSQEKEGKTPAATTLLIDRFVGLFGLIVMAFFALVFNLEFILEQEKLTFFAWLVTGLFLGTVLFYTIVIFPFKEGKDPFILFFQRLPGHKLTIKVYQAFKTYQHQKMTLVGTLLMSIVIHTSVAFMFFQIAHMIGMTELDLAAQFFIMPLGLIVIALPIAPGGFGVGHLAFGELYALIGISGGTDIFNLFFFVQFSIFLLGGIPYLLYSGEYHLPKSEEEDLGPEEPDSSTSERVASRS